METECSDLKEVLHKSRLEQESLSLTEQNYKKFLVECYNQFTNIRHRYVQNTLVTSQVDLTLRQDFQTDREVAILELVAMIGNITNVLQFEIKNADLKNTQI